MKRTQRTGITATAALLLAGFVSAQKGPGPASSRYDASRERTVSGTIEAVVEVPGGRLGSGLHVTLASGGENWDVALGPKDFSKSIGLEPAKGDAIQATGAADGERKTVLAREIKKGDKTYRLRDERGIPLWSRGRRR